MQLEALFQPRSIAVIGASEKPTVGRRVVASLDRIGFTGRIYPVNPSYPTVLGHACYASMAELPEEPDVAVFCLGNARVLGAFVAAAGPAYSAASASVLLIRKRIGDDLDRRLQRVEPMLAIPGVRSFARMAEGCSAQYPL